MRYQTLRILMLLVLVASHCGPGSQMCKPAV